MNVRILGEAKLRRYYVLATKQGEVKRLFPRYARSLPIVDSPDLAMQQVLDKISRDPAFRARYAGWRFSPVEFGNSVRISDDGASISRCD